MNYHHIPDIIKQYPHWVCWRYEDKGNNKLDKVPYQSTSSIPASILEPTHWSTFPEAVANVHNFDGIGFVFSESDPFAVIDIDKREGVTVVQRQAEIIRSLQSYTEISPSGEGAHTIVIAATKAGHRYSMDGEEVYELYSHTRYMTFTGNMCQGTSTIEPRQHIVDQLVEECNQKQKITAAYAESVEQPETVDDNTIYQMASNASNGDKFTRLWQGDLTDYNGDHSRADFAMIDILSFYTRAASQVARLFRMSGLGQRPKAKRDKYVDDMIVKSRDNQQPVMSREDMLVLKDSFKKRIPSRAKEEYLPGGSMSLPPGLTGRIAESIYKSSYKPIAEISICAALGMMAGIAGRAYNANGTGLNLYMLLLANTGRGKEAMSSGINRILKEVRVMFPDAEHHMGPGDLASGQALIKYIADHPTGSFVSVFGEFGIKLKSLCDPHAFGPSLMLQKALLDLFSKSGNGQALRSTEYSTNDKNVPTVYSPAFSMIGESTPAWFYDHVNTDMIASGLLPRFTLVDYTGERPASNYDADNYVIPSDLVANIAGLMGQVATLNHSQTVMPVTFNENARAMFVKLDQACDYKINTSQSETTSEMWNRAHLKTLRIAALLAVGKNPYEPIIDEECWIWAERFVCDTTERLIKRFQKAGIGKPVEDRVVLDLKQFLLRYLERKPKSANPEIHRHSAISLTSFIEYARNTACFRDTRRGRKATLMTALTQLQDERLIYKLAPYTIPVEGKGVPVDLWSIDQDALIDNLDLEGV